MAAVAGTAADRVETSLQEMLGLRDGMEARSREINAKLNQINQIEAAPCSIEYRHAAERIVVQSVIVQDIVFHRDGELCSVVSDQATSFYNRLLTETPPIMYINRVGVEFQRGVRFVFAPDVDFTLATKGAATLVMRSMDFPVQLRNGRGLNLTVLALDANNAYVRLSGPDVQADAPALTPLSLTASGLKEMACNSTATLCFVTSLHYRALIRQYWSLIALVGLLGGVGGGFAGQAFLVWRTHMRSMTRRLRIALRTGKLHVAYQPIAEANTGRVVGAEALVRWTIEGGQSISPDVFVPVAEEAGLANELTATVLRIVMNNWAGSLKEDPSFRVSINIVPSDLEQPEFPRLVAESIEGCGVSPGQIAFEITERQQLKEGVGTRTMRALRDRGYRFYVDDFGTGYSSVGYLADLPIEAVKIDRSFTEGVGTDMARGRLVRPMMDMARELSLLVIAEGVERPEQAAFFRSYADVRIQGWLVGRAMSASELIALRKGQQAAAA